MFGAILTLGLAGAILAAETSQATSSDQVFWSFRPLGRPDPPIVEPGSPASPPGSASLDAFLRARLREKGLDFAPAADRGTLIRRVTLDLTGLPPTPQEVEAFVGDDSVEAYARLVDRLLESPRYGERWAQQWLDAAGYSDSNGYHRNDTPRPHAYRYRDYVIRSVQEDKPYDRFLLEQLAGDELVGDLQKPRLTPEEVDTLTATQFLRNAPDGTDSTEGNEAARTIERYAVLEEQAHITFSALFGLTIDCARCHDHKFDPIPQRDYYALQAVFYPAFNVKSWTQPKDRWIHAAGADEIRAWKAQTRERDGEAAALRREFEAWIAEQRVDGPRIFEDRFASDRVGSRWSAVAPGDELKAGQKTVALDSRDPGQSPSAVARDGKLQLGAAPGSDSVWLSTRESFDWTPDSVGGWIQASFELTDDKGAEGKRAERIGYYIAMHDHDDHGNVAGGNILIDGNPNGGAAVHLDHPGPDTRALGTIGARRYEPGHSYGVRVIRAAEDEYLLAQVVDGRIDDGMIQLRGADLPDGGFGFELCCSRSFVVDDVVIQSSSEGGAAGSFAAELGMKRRSLESGLRAVEAKRLPEPVRIAWTTDLSAAPPEVPLLRRGDYFQPAELVQPGALSALSDPGEALEIAPPRSGASTTGRRLALARWATRPGSRAAALLARVQANRIWLGHFGRGIVETPENFGARGSPPSHPDLLEWLAASLIEGGWKQKRLHRIVVLSAAYRQASKPNAAAMTVDPENRYLWQYPSRRLDAEAIRDSMLAVGGALNLEMAGPPVEFDGLEDGEVVLRAPGGPGPHAVDRRSIYLRHRRSQPVTFLQAFDLASMDPNCLSRGSSAVVSQSLAMLNGSFAIRMGTELAARIEREAPAGPGDHEARVRRGFLIALGRPPGAAELARCLDFLESQTALYRGSSIPGHKDAAGAALQDLARMLLASNEFGYLE